MCFTKFNVKKVEAKKKLRKIEIKPKRKRKKNNLSDLSWAFCVLFTGSLSSLYEPYKQHNMAPNYRGQNEIFYSQKRKFSIKMAYLIPYVCYLLPVGVVILLACVAGGMRERARPP